MQSQNIQRYREATKEYGLNERFVSVLPMEYISDHKIYEPIVYNQISNTPEDIYFLTGFKINDFDEIYSACEKYLIKAEMERVRKSKFAPKDKFIILVAYLIKNFKFDKLGSAFSISGPSACKIVNSTAETIK
ncbi:hypothetical protein AYI68_g5369 [Smittium mucronatum]|uniref:Transposase Helix-turn-helix domain-containing protein n=1 Tax=Smittium mucronatum TaxID=133383 RepID=A0A1R0GUE9_9FUNG|nr:hypothetical protein AYI68_g5369 [Smittium mucronatum]